VASTLKGDPYGNGPVCTLSAPGINSNLGLIGLSGSDITFYVTSDLHYFRETFNLTDQLMHLRQLNNYPSTHPVWPSGTGAFTGTAVAPRAALIIDGDLTTEGQDPQLGAYRLNYEQGRIPAGIQYPVLFGLLRRAPRSRRSSCLRPELGIPLSEGGIEFIVEDLGPCLKQEMCPSQ
jgi:hypothetical protein